MRGLFQGPCPSSKQIKQELLSGSWTSSPPPALHPQSPRWIQREDASVVRVSFINQTGIGGSTQEEALVRRLRTLLVNLTGSIKGCRLWRGWFPKQISPRAPPRLLLSRFRRSTIPACSRRDHPPAGSDDGDEKSGGLPSNPQWMGWPC